MVRTINEGSCFSSENARRFCGLFTRSVITAAILSGAMFISNSFAQESDQQVFVSLTRKAESLKDMPTNVSIISGESIRRSGARNIAEILKGKTGLNIGQSGTIGSPSNVLFRGSSSEQTLIMIDGVRINDPSMGIVDITELPAENIDRIEIIRGASSAIYGSGAFGGMINIITKKSDNAAPLAEMGLSYQSFNTQIYKIGFSAIKDNTSGLITASKTLSDGWRDNSNYDDHNIFMRLSYENEKLGKFDLSNLFFKSNAGVPGLGVSLDLYDSSIERSSSSPDANQKRSKIHSRLENLKQFEENSLKTVIYAINNKTDYKVPSWMENSNYNSFTYGSEMQLTNINGITAGAEWWREKYSQIDLNTNSELVDRSRTTTAGYLQKSCKYEEFELIPNLRIDHNSVYGTVFSPRITLVFHASDFIKMSANSGKAWRAPTFNELFWPKDTSFFFGTTYVTLGNEDLKPEEGIASDMGVEYTCADFNTKATFFRTDSKNLISWQDSSDIASNTVTTSPNNIGKSRQQGIELEIHHKITSGLYHQINYTYLDARDTINDRKLNYRPENTVSYEIAYLTSWNMKTRLNLLYVGTQETWDIWAPIVDSLPEYAIAGFNISQKVLDTEIWLNIDNLTDKKYQTRLEFPLPGITISAGLNIKFWGTTF